MHFESRHEGVPVGNGAPAGPGMQVDSRQSERRWNESRCRFAIRTKALAVEEQLGVEFSGTPSGQHLAHAVLVYPEKTCDGAQVGSETDNCADIEIAVGPAIQPVSDARRERVVHTGMTQSALYADRLQAQPGTERARQTDNRIELQQRQRHRQIIKIHQPGAQLPLQGSWQSIDIHLQANGERRFRADTGAYSSKTTAFDRLVQPQSASPESLIAKGVEAEHLLAAQQQVMIALSAQPVVRERSGWQRANSNHREKKTQHHTHNSPHRFTFPVALDVAR